MKKLAIAFLFFGHAVCAQQTGRIDTDRPDQTESAFLLPKKFFQAELGLLKENEANENYTITHPAALLKYGLSNRVELRMEIAPQTHYLQMIPATEVKGILPPVNIGTKLRFWEEAGLLPKTSLIMHFGLPFLASPKLTGEPMPFDIRLTMQHTLSEQMSLGYNLGLETGGGEETHFIYTLAPGVEFGKRWYAYAELFGSFFNGYAEHYADGGLAFYVTDNAKLDISAGTALGDYELKNYVSIGFSFRLPLAK